MVSIPDFLRGEIGLPSEQYYEKEKNAEMVMQGTDSRRRCCRRIFCGSSYRAYSIYSTACEARPCEERRGKEKKGAQQTSQKEKAQTHLSRRSRREQGEKRGKKKGVEASRLVLYGTISDAPPRCACARTQEETTMHRDTKKTTAR
jgi:hypothetical protein